MPRDLVLAMTLLGTATTVRAQAAGASADTTRSRECWRGQRAPICDSFFITEFGVDRIQSSSTTHFDVDYGQNGGIVHYSDPDFGRRLQFTLGPMFNRGASRAIGGTVSFSSVRNGFRAAVEGRHRWWLPVSALDLSAGALRIDEPSASATVRRTEYGVTAGVHLIASDLLNVTGRADVTMGHGGSHVGMSLGFGVGSWLTPIVAPFVLIGNGLAHALDET